MTLPKAAAKTRKKTASPPKAAGSHIGAGNGGDSMKETSVKSAFDDIMMGSTYFEVCPNACVPIAQIRPLSASGVRRLKAHILGETCSGQSFGLGGLVQGTDTAIIVEVRGTLRPLLKDFMKGQGLNDVEANSRLQSRDVWYAIIDGAHMHAAIMEVMQDNVEKWAGFKWRVTLLQGGKPMYRYRQLARAQNERHDRSFHIEVTLFDKLSGLKEVFDLITRERNGRKATAMDVAKQYDGMSHTKDNALKQTASTAIRLSNSVIQTIGEIMTSEHPEICLSVPAMNKTGKRSSEEISQLVDCRVYRNFLSLSTLKSATGFMNAKGKDGEKAQVYALHRVKQLYEEKEFKALQQKVLSEQFQLATGAVAEEHKFNAFLDGEAWPAEMETSRTNLTRGTRFDQDIVENRGNDTDILPILLNRYRQLSPSVAPMKEAKYRANNIEVAPVVQGTIREMDAKSAESSGTVTCLVSDVEGGLVMSSDAQEKEPTGQSAEGSAEEPGNGSVENGEEGEKIPECKGAEKQHTKGAGTSHATEVLDTSTAQTPIVDDAPDPNERLRSLAIHNFQMTWQLYAKEVRDHFDDKVDGIVCDPPSGLPNDASKSGKQYEDYLDDAEMTNFAGFCKRCLKPGGYVFLFTSDDYLPRWKRAYRECKFTVMNGPYVMMNDSDQLHRRALNGLPQVSSEFAMVAVAQGPRSDGFLPDFDSPFHLINCQMKRRFAAVYNVPVSKNKLMYSKSKSPIRVEEKSIELLTEILDIFIPGDGVVMDPYAGTLTTAIACMQSGRRCFSIEKDAVCFSEALARLRLQAMAIPMYEQTRRPIHATNGVSKGVSKGVHTESSHASGKQNNDVPKHVTVGNPVPDKQALLPGKDCGAGRASSGGESAATINGGVSSRDAIYNTEDAGVKQDKGDAWKGSKGREEDQDVGKRRAGEEAFGNRRSKRQKNALQKRTVPSMNPVSHLVSGGKVRLLIGKKAVGTAVCHIPLNESSLFSRSLHGSDLESFERDGEHLITVKRIDVDTVHGSEMYPYENPGQEEAPATMADIYRAGMYVWDSHMLETLE